MNKTVNEYKMEIEENETIAKRHEMELEQYIQPYANILSKELAEKAKSLVIREVKEQPQITKDWGRDIKSLKDKLGVLIEATPEVVSKKIESSKVIIHRDADCITRLQEYELHQLWETRIRVLCSEVLGAAGELLYRFKYVEPTDDYMRKGEWQFITGTGGRVKYGYSMSFSKELEDYQEQYWKMIREYKSVLRKLESLKNGLEEQEAIELWESV